MVKIAEDSKVPRRIMDMGIGKSTRVKIEGKVFWKNIIEVTVEGYKLTLRKVEAKNIDAEVNNYKSEKINALNNLIL